MLADSHSVVNRWMNLLCQLLNVQVFKEIRQIQIDTAETVVPKPSAVRVEMTTVKLKVTNCKVLMHFRQLTQAGGKHNLLKSMNGVMLFGIRRLLLHLFIRRGKAFDRLRGKICVIVFIKFGIPTKVVKVNSYMFK